MQKRGKQPRCTPMALHAHPELNRKRDVWMFVNYQRPKVTFCSYLDRMTSLLASPSFCPSRNELLKECPSHIQKLFPAVGYIPSLVCPTSWWKNKALYDENLTAVALCPGTSIQISWVPFLTYPCHTSIICVHNFSWMCKLMDCQQRGHVLIMLLTMLKAFTAFCYKGCKSRKQSSVWHTKHLWKDCQKKHAHMCPRPPPSVIYVI